MEREEIRSFRNLACLSTIIIALGLAETEKEGDKGQDREKGRDRDKERDSL